ncbi:hypothetical protein C0Q70_18721 [Pomacea canaliculata]|uniref:Uncharacterized protein n=1 Tax=Pomacea canaliculata TaxID=400727 RepID=A0A2T7NHD5_POMCA|nr:hypothetical protein C0Q70_18721 [Pomacea canaliculata]
MDAKKEKHIEKDTDKKKLMVLTQEEEKEYETKENEDKTCEDKENEEEKKDDDDDKNKSQAEDAEGDNAKKVDPNDVLSLLVKTRQSARRKEAEMKKKVDVIKMGMNRSPQRLPSLTLLVDVPGMKTVGSEELPEAKTSCASAPGPENSCMWRVAQVWTYPSCQCLTHPSVYSCECQCLVFCDLFGEAALSGQMTCAVTQEMSVKHLTIKERHFLTCDDDQKWNIM